MIDRDELVATLPRLRRYARLLAGDRNRADDLTQDPLARAIERESAFHAGQNLRAWLFALMHNLFVDGLRHKEAIDWSANLDTTLETTAEPADSSDPAQTREILDALERLPADQRAVLVLIGVEGLRYREAAEVLGVPVGTVMSRLARAREKMQGLLGDVAIAAGNGGLA